MTCVYLASFPATILQNVITRSVSNQTLSSEVESIQSRIFHVFGLVVFVQISFLQYSAKQRSIWTDLTLSNQSPKYRTVLRVLPSNSTLVIPTSTSTLKIAITYFCLCSLPFREIYVVCGFGSKYVQIRLLIHDFRVSAFHLVQEN